MRVCNLRTVILLPRYAHSRSHARTHPSAQVIQYAGSSRPRRGLFAGGVVAVVVAAQQQQHTIRFVGMIFNYTHAHAHTYTPTIHLASTQEQGRPAGRRRRRLIHLSSSSSLLLSLTVVWCCCCCWLRIQHMPNTRAHMHRSYCVNMSMCLCACA